VIFGLLVGAAPARAGRVERLRDALLRSENYKVRLKAATQLGRTRSPVAIGALTVGLGDPHALVRAASVNSLGRIGDASSLPAICKLQSDESDFVRRTAAKVIAKFGGPKRCTPKRVFVAVEVSGDTVGQSIRDFVRDGLESRMTSDERVVFGRTLDLANPGGSGEDPLAAVREGRMPGVELKLTLSQTVDRSSGTVRVHCSVAQAVFDMKLRALRGTATQRAEIDLGSLKVTDEAIARQARECLGALVPVVWDGLASYLDRVQ